MALYPEFTVGETLSYFGRLHGMSAAEIERGAETLTQVLDLPPHRNNRAIKTLRLVCRKLRGIINCPNSNIIRVQTVHPLVIKRLVNDKLGGVVWVPLLHLP